MAEETEKEKTKEKKRSPQKLVIVAVVVAAVLAGAAFVAWQLFLSPSADVMEGAAVPGVFQEADLEDTMSKTYALETFVVNLNDPGGKRYLKTNIELEYTLEEVGAELAHRLPQLRDLILLQLSSKSLDDIQSVDGKIELRRELIQRINQILTSGKIRNLYFTQFVIQ